MLIAIDSWMWKKSLIKPNTRKAIRVKWTALNEWWLSTLTVDYNGLLSMGKNPFC